MLKFILYCDLSTMNCTADDINTELSTFTISYSQVNNSLWFFKYDDQDDFDPLPKEEHLFYDYFKKFTNDNSIIFIEALRNDYYYYILPDEVFDFLESD